MEIYVQLKEKMFKLESFKKELNMPNMWGIYKEVITFRERQILKYRKSKVFGQFQLAKSAPGHFLIHPLKAKNREDSQCSIWKDKRHGSVTQFPL